MLGESYEYSADGKTVTLTLKSGVWSDGQPLTAKDVVFTLGYGPNKTDKLVKAEATSDTAVVLTYSTPQFTSASQLLGATMIVPQHIWSKIDNYMKATNDDPVGSGAYVVNTTSDAAYTLTANPNYRDGAPPITDVQYLGLDSNQSGQYRGRIVERRPADEVILHPQHEYTRALREAAADPERLGRLREEVRAELATGGVGAAGSGTPDSDEEGGDERPRHPRLAGHPQRPGRAAAAAGPRPAQPVAAQRPVRALQADRRADDRPAGTDRTDRAARRGVGPARPGSGRLRRPARRAGPGPVSVLGDRLHAVLVDPTGAEHPMVELATAGWERSPALDVTTAVQAACTAAGTARDCVAAVAIGVQAAVDAATDTLSHTDTLPGWPAHGSRALIEAATGLQVLLDNDVNLAAGAERADGAAGEAPDFA